MDRKLNITVIVSRPVGEEAIDIAWDEPALPPVGQRTAQSPKAQDGAPYADAESPRGDAGAD